jgi:hypothetical protein
MKRREKELAQTRQNSHLPGNLATGTALYLKAGIHGRKVFDGMHAVYTMVSFAKT